MRDKWHPEVTHYSRAPLLLVGTKSDLRDDKETVAALARKKKEPVTYAQGVAMAKSGSAKKNWTNTYRVSSIPPPPPKKMIYCHFLKLLNFSKKKITLLIYFSSNSTSFFGTPSRSGTS